MHFRSENSTLGLATCTSHNRKLDIYFTFCLFLPSIYYLLGARSKRGKSIHSARWDSAGLRQSVFDFELRSKFFLLVGEKR